jgi:endonuclease YncB( thermonuclease family)
MAKKYALLGHIGSNAGHLHVPIRTNYRRLLHEGVLRSGYANLLPNPPNLKYEERFLKAYMKAGENGRGLWKLK